MTFWIVFGFDTVLAFAFLFFFLVGIADGSVTPANMALWITILTVLMAIVVGSLTLRVKERNRAAMSLALALGVPGLLVGLLFVGTLLLQPDFK